MSEVEARKIKLQVWPINDNTKSPSELFPEQIEGYVQVNEGSVGIAASGGGSRAHALCGGYYRALRDLKYMDKVDYISAVSGGAWASSIYVYAQGENQRLDYRHKFQNLKSVSLKEKIRRKAVDLLEEYELLGRHNEPEVLTTEFLGWYSSGTLTEVIHAGFVKKTLAGLIFESFTGKKLWQRMIGSNILKRFGLQKKIFLQSYAHREKLLTRDMIKKTDSIVLPRDGKPFLIINAALGGPRQRNSGWGESLQITSMYAGVPFFSNKTSCSFHYKADLWTTFILFVRSMLGSLTKHLSRLHDRDYNNPDKKVHPKPQKIYSGGGVISSYAFGTKKLVEENAYYGSTTGTLFEGEIEAPFFLEDAVGASSCAFAAYVENFLPFLKIFPYINYFPVLNKKQAHKITDAEFKVNLEKQRSLADGGNYENTGIMPLIQRGLKNIIVFINSMVPLYSFKKDSQGNINFEDKKIFSEGSLVDRGHVVYHSDSQLHCLFGHCKTIQLSANYTHNQIFDENDFDLVMEGLLKSIQEGRGGVFYREMVTVKNEFWSIKAGEKIRFLFVYNETCQKFVEKLPKDTQMMIEDKESRLHSFPHFDTQFASARPVALTRAQTNIIIAQADYILRMKENKEDLEKLFERSTKK